MVSCPSLYFVRSSMQQSLTVLVPRVWPFLRHTISSVRRAALETLYTLLSKYDEVKLTSAYLAKYYLFKNGIEFHAYNTVLLKQDNDFEC